MTNQEYNVIVTRLKEILRNTPNLLTPTQKKVSIPIVVRIAKKTQKGLFASTIAIKDNKICSGHHRYLANLLVNRLPEIVPGELSYGHSSYEWSGVTFSSEDFDSAEEREYYTLQTAIENGLHVAVIRNILNNLLIL